MRCLVVDDNQPFAENLAEILEDLGEQAVVATSGIAALEALRANEFQLLFCDYRMTGMNGAQVIREALRIQSHLVTIIVSAFANEADLAEATAEGATAIWNKPLPMAELKQLLHTLPLVPRLSLHGTATKSSR